MSTYKIRRMVTPKTKGSDKPYEACSLAVPMDIAKVLPEDIRFTAELTDEGILYRPAKVAPAPTELPAWLRSESKNNSKTAVKSDKQEPKTVVKAS